MRLFSEGSSFYILTPSRTRYAVDGSAFSRNTTNTIWKGTATLEIGNISYTCIAELSPTGTLEIRLETLE